MTIIATVTWHCMHVTTKQTIAEIECVYMCFVSYYDEQLRMPMGTMYVADGLRATLVNVEACVETFQQISMEEM